MGPCIQVYSGRNFWPLSPRVEDVDIVDIAHALSNQCRFNGHCTRFYSVAEHCVHVASVLRHHSPEVRFWGLLHDASEAYLPDVVTPMKKYLDGFEGIETELLMTIAARFDLDFPIPKQVKKADLMVQHAEKLQAMRPGQEWNLPFPPADITLCFWGPEAAEARFMQEFRAYENWLDGGCL